MSEYAGRRDQAQRDAMTVEIGYALCSAAFAAAVVFGAVAGPAFAFDFSAGARDTLVGTGATVGAVVFVARVISVLVRFHSHGADGDTEPAAQPNQPGRTNPDS